MDWLNIPFRVFLIVVAVSYVVFAIVETVVYFRRTPLFGTRRMTDDPVDYERTWGDQ